MVGFVFLSLLLFLITTLEGIPHDLQGRVNQYGSSDNQVTEEDYKAEAPHFLSQPLEISVDKGQTVRLPCLVDHLDKFVLLWRKNGRIISIGDQITDKSESKFHIEQSENDNTIVIENVDEKDEANFSCSISENTKIEISHNVKVRSASTPGHYTVTVLNKNSLNDFKDAKEYPPAWNDKGWKWNEEKQEYIDEKKHGKIYFARIPSFYTLPDTSTKQEQGRLQIIKHSPKSYTEFLKLLRIYHNSILTKGLVKDFKEFNLKKRPIPNNNQLRSTHNYYNHLRNGLQRTKNIEIENKETSSNENYLNSADAEEDMGNEYSEEELKKKSDDVFVENELVDDGSGYEWSSEDSNEYFTEKEGIETEENNIERTTNNHILNKNGSGKEVKENQRIESVQENKWAEIGSGYEQITPENTESMDHEIHLMGINSGARYLHENELSDMQIEEANNIEDKMNTHLLRGRHMFTTEIENIVSQHIESDDEEFTESSEDFSNQLTHETIVEDVNSESEYDVEGSGEKHSSEDNPKSDVRLKENNISFNRKTTLEYKEHMDTSTLQEIVLDDNLEEQDSENKIVHKETSLNEKKQEPHFSVRYLHGNEIDKTPNDETENNLMREQFPVFRGHHVFESDLEDIEYKHDIKDEKDEIEDNIGGRDLELTESVEGSGKLNEETDDMFEEHITIHEEKTDKEEENDDNHLHKVPVYRGQHYLKTDLEGFNSEHVQYGKEGSGEDNEINESEDSENSDDSNSEYSDESDSEYSDKSDSEYSDESDEYKESIDVDKAIDVHTDTNADESIHSSEASAIKNTVNINKDNMYPKEIKEIERKYFLKDPETKLYKDKDLKDPETNLYKDKHHPLLINGKEDDEKENEREFGKQKKTFTPLLINEEEAIEEDSKDETYLEMKEQTEIITPSTLFDPRNIKSMSEKEQNMKRKKKNMSNGPHPFRFICRILKKCRQQ